MIDEDLLSTFLKQFDGLKQVVAKSSARSITDPPDSLFYDYQNIFIKSFLVSACSMLEAFIQDLVEAYVGEIQYRINKANLPFNLVTWISDHEKAKLAYKVFEAKKTKKDISDLISPNYWKTIKAFERVGINLASSQIDEYRDIITARVAKRNRIVHHNDDALDLSFSDVMDTIDKFKEYIKCLFSAVMEDPHRTT